MNEKEQSAAAEVLAYFREVAAIPRPSGKEGKIREYLIRFADRHALAHAQDAAGNLIIRKPAAEGCEGKPKMALQAHIDMVCEKNAATRHDFLTEGIKIVNDGDWLRADGTTLGADNGIGVAAMLAVLASRDIRHGALECLFTVEEETGLSGALGIAPDLLTATTLLNLDSEEDHELIIGCAGGIDTLAKFKIEREKSADGYYFFSVHVSGLQGGHSGEDIDKRRANANKLLAQFLWQLNKKTDVRLAAISGGNLRNAIPREASAVAAVPFAEKEKVIVELNHFLADAETVWREAEPNFRMEIESENKENEWLAKSLSDRLLNALYACPHGVLAMSADIEGLVETSTNLASVKTVGDEIVVSTSQRSSIDAAKRNATQTVESVFLLAGAQVVRGDGYPGWQPNVGSRILAVAAQSYRTLFGEEPKVRAIHAGLECGLFLQKYPALDMVSFGPTILDVHSPAERLSIPSTQKFVRLLIDILEKE